MPRIDSLLKALDEKLIAQTISIRHDEARMRYSLRSNTVPDFATFSCRVADYTNYHFSTCISPGGLNPTEAASRGKEMIEAELRRRHGDVVTAFRDARDGLNGGMRQILDLIAERMKEEAIARYVREVFAYYVDPSSWEEKVEIMRQFIAHLGPELASSIDVNHPERYAHEYEELIRAYVSALRETSSVFRRL